MVGSGEYRWGNKIVTFLMKDDRDPETCWVLDGRGNRLRVYYDELVFTGGKFPTNGMARTDTDDGSLF